VPETLSDWHKQVATIFAQLLYVQKFVRYEMEIWNWWERITLDVYSPLFPILVIKGDMSFLNKIVGMRGGQKTINICCFCNIPRTSLDDPYQRFWLTDLARVACTMLHNFKQISMIRYYHMKKNIFHDFVWCHEYGINQSTNLQGRNCQKKKGLDWIYVTSTIKWWHALHIFSFRIPAQCQQ